MQTTGRRPPSKYRHVSMEAVPVKFYRKGKKDNPRNTIGKTERKTRQPKQCLHTAAWEEHAVRMMSVHLWHPQCSREPGSNGPARCSAIILYMIPPWATHGTRYQCHKRSKEHTDITLCSKRTFLVLCLMRFPEVSGNSHS